MMDLSPTPLLLLRKQLSSNSELEVVTSSSNSASPITSRTFKTMTAIAATAASESPDSAIHSAYYSPVQSPIPSCAGCCSIFNIFKFVCKISEKILVNGVHANEKTRTAFTHHLSHHHSVEITVTPVNIRQIVLLPRPYLPLLTHRY